MQIRHDLGPEFEEHVHLPARLGLALHEEVPVQVEQVVVPAPARPGLVVFGGDPRLVRPTGLRDPVLVHEAVPPVGVLHGVDQHQRLGQDEVDIGVSCRREQVVGLRHGGAARTDLVAVDPMHERGDDRKFGQQRFGLCVGEPARVGEPCDPRLHLVETRHALGRPDDEDDERTALPALRVAHEARAVRGRVGQRLHVPDHIVRRRDGLPEVVPRHLFERWDGRVVAGSRHQFLRLSGQLDHRGKRERG